MFFKKNTIFAVENIFTCLKTKFKTMDTQENNPTAKKETLKIDGISPQINLSPGSEAHKQFARLMKETGADSNRDLAILLMNNYENPPQDSDSATTIMNLEREVANLKAENKAYDATVQNLETENQQLKDQLENARNEANDNALRGTTQQNELDELRQRVSGAIILKPNPVSAFFLKEMAEKQNTTPGKILERLFIDDLQNPRANNLPYTVSSSRIREVMEKLKQQQQ